MWPRSLLSATIGSARGLGTALATRTLLAAEVGGFDQFVAQVLHGNVGVMRRLDRAGIVMSRKTRREVSEVTFVRRGRRQQCG